MFKRDTIPSLIVVDGFYDDPDKVRTIALAQNYGEDLRYFKGLRTHERFLWPWLREEFARLLGVPVKRWLEYPANGVFQQTRAEDSLVWHHDTQTHAAAVYLSPDGGPSSGTSFWRERTYGCRRRPTHPAEVERLRDVTFLGEGSIVDAARAVVYDPHNLEHPDHWELVDRVAGIYNRLVIWDASLIHSATSYGPGVRLVHLFFFDVDVPETSIEP